MPLNIVLIEPEIPNNTGNIGRLALASGCNLHLVKPLGFKIDDKRLRRAGLDYWQHLNVSYYENINDFFARNKKKKIVYLSSHGSQAYYNIPFEDDLFMLFGKESIGLPKSILEIQANSVFKIPIINNHVRSLNLANAVSIVVYEGIKQLKNNNIL